MFLEQTILIIIFGRIAFPIYAFFISEGYIHTRNFAKYLGRLLIFAVISQIPAYLLLEPYLNGQPYLNIFFTLALGLLAIRFYDKAKNKPVGIILVILTALFGELLHVDYGMYGILLIAIFFILRDHKIIMMLASSIILIISRLTLIPACAPIYYIAIIEQLALSIFAVGSLLLIAAYNGKLGKSNKYIKMGFYAFYPVHLILFNIIRLVIR